MKGVNRLLPLCAYLSLVFLVLFCISVIISLLVSFLYFLGSAYTSVQSKTLFPVDMNLLACLYLESFLSPSALACTVALQGSLHWHLWSFRIWSVLLTAILLVKFPLGSHLLFRRTFLYISFADFLLQLSIPFLHSVYLVL